MQMYTAGYRHLPQLFQEVDVPQNKDEFCADQNIRASAFQPGEQFTDSAEKLLLRVAAVSVTEPITTCCPAYFFGFVISGQFFTPWKVPHSSVCPVKRFMNEA